jgi:hypothetical protein
VAYVVRREFGSSRPMSKKVRRLLRTPTIDDACS